MAILDPNQIFFTAFEPKQKNRFILYVEGVPAYLIKGVSGMGFSQEEIVLNHINVYRKIKGKLKWNDLTLTLFDPITPSGAQATMEWVRLHAESVTGRMGYAAGYKKDIDLEMLDPTGVVVEKWILYGTFLTNVNFNALDYKSDALATITASLQMDRCVLVY